MVWAKNGHSLIFFFLGNIGQENVSYDILERKIAFLGYKKKKFKSWKIDIFPTFFFFDNIGQENVFYDILERKIAFLGYKNKKFNSRKIDIFPKGLTRGFGPKMGILATFFFWQYRPGKCLLQ